MTPQLLQVRQTFLGAVEIWTSPPPPDAYVLGDVIEMVDGRYLVWNGSEWQDWGRSH